MNIYNIYMKYFLQFRLDNDNIESISLFDLKQDLEYKKTHWGLISRGIADKHISYYQHFYILTEKEFIKIRDLNPNVFYYFNYKDFLKNVGLEHFLI